MKPISNKGNRSQWQTVGIMISETSSGYPIDSQRYIRRLCRSGARFNLVVFTFAPAMINWQLQQVTGYTLNIDTDQWVKRVFTIPHLIYDRCFFKNRRQYLLYQQCLYQLKQLKSVRFLGNQLNGKWSVQQVLMQEPSLRPHLLPSESFTKASQLITWLQAKGKACLKPQASSQGKGILLVTRHADAHYSVLGRNHMNRQFELSFKQLSLLLQWIKQFIKHRRYLIQDFLSLASHSGTVYDIRSLMQKNEQGSWSNTGMAVRQGAPGSITSNLHGGGTAAEVVTYLQNQFGKQRAVEIETALGQLSYQIPPFLEQYYGRLSELGIDFGVDTNGHIWLLEVNSKPGRAIFSQLKKQNQMKLATYNPIYYARYILDRQLGG